MKDFIEQQIIDGVRKLLMGRVNEILRDWGFDIPVIEFGKFNGGNVTVPAVALASCERTEKERVIRMDAYSLTVAFSLPETVESEMSLYAYSAAVCMALKENPTLGGVADRAVITGKKYVPPKKANCGNEWEAVIYLRVTVEEMYVS